MLGLYEIGLLALGEVPFAPDDLSFFTEGCQDEWEV